MHTKRIEDRACAPELHSRYHRRPEAQRLEASSEPQEIFKKSKEKGLHRVKTRFFGVDFAAFVKG